MINMHGYIMCCNNKIYIFRCSLATALYRFRSQQILQLILISGGGPTPLAASVRDHELSPFNCAELFLKPLLVCGLKR